MQNFENCINHNAKCLVIGAYSSITATIERLKTSGECDTNRCTVIKNQFNIDTKENSTMKRNSYSNEIANVVAYGQFWRTAGPHFPASQRHNKRTVKFQAIKPYAAKGALHE